MLFSWLDFLTVLAVREGQVKTMDTQSLLALTSDGVRA